MEKGNRERLPRSFVEVDNHSAVDGGWACVAAPCPVQVKKPQFSEAFQEAAIREGADELTLPAEEVGTQRAFINRKHFELERWGPPLGDAHRHAICPAICKGIEGDEWEALQRAEQGRGS